MTVSNTFDELRTMRRQLVQLEPSDGPLRTWESLLWHAYVDAMKQRQNVELPVAGAQR